MTRISLLLQDFLVTVRRTVLPIFMLLRTVIVRLLLSTDCENFYFRQLWLG